jgi:hypothetical protein
MRETRHLRRKKNKTLKRKIRTPKRKIRTPKRKTRTPKRKTKTLKRKIRAKGPSGIDETKSVVAKPNEYTKEEIDVALTLLELSEENLHFTPEEASYIGKAMRIDPFNFIENCNKLKNDEIYIKSDINFKKNNIIAEALLIIDKEKKRIQQQIILHNRRYYHNRRY